MWGNNRAVAPTFASAIVSVKLGDNFIVKGHHLPMIKAADLMAMCGPIRISILPNSSKFAVCCDMAPPTWTPSNSNFSHHLFPEMQKVDDKPSFKSSTVVLTMPHKPSLTPDEFFSIRPTGSLPSNTQTNPKPSETNDKPYCPPPARNKHVNIVFTRSGKTYDPPKNSNDETTIIHNYSDDEADEAEKEEEQSSFKPKILDQSPLKAYKPKISYPQRLRKENMEEPYAKFIDLIKEVRIHVPLVDVIDGIPNYR
nr:reverse transcriptase domain-containing protein [Tanacetum cinerariifolium]